MNWIYEGMKSFLWQIALFAMFMAISAAVIWSCNYLQISPGYGIISLYTLVIMIFNLALAREKQKWSPPANAK
jgi:hypothetical protein